MANHSPPEIITLVPYERVYTENGILKRGTMFVDHIVSWIIYAVRQNQPVIARLCDAVKLNPDFKVNIPNNFVDRELVGYYLRVYKFLLGHTAHGADVTWNLACPYFQQTAQILWLANRSRLANYSLNDYTNDMSPAMARDLPVSQTVRSFTQMQTLNALASLAYFAKHIPYTQAFDRLATMIMLQSFYFLMGKAPRPSRLFDGDRDNAGMAQLCDDGVHYVATGRYVMHLSMRFFYLTRLSCLMRMRSRPINAAEEGFISDYSLADKIRDMIYAYVTKHGDVVEQKKSDMLYNARISLGDSELNRAEYHGQQQLPTEIIRNMHPANHMQMLAALADMSRITPMMMLDGSEGIDIAESIAVKIFFEHVSGCDTPIPLENGFVIRNDVVDSEPMSGKIMSSREPLLVQLDARFHLVCARKRVITHNVYEALAVWLAIVYLEFKGIPEESAGCLYNTYIEFCGNNLKLPPKALVLE